MKVIKKGVKASCGYAAQPLSYCILFQNENLILDIKSKDQNSKEALLLSLRSLQCINAWQVIAIAATSFSMKPKETFIYKKILLNRF
jgi:hypothetical protein